MRQMSAGRAREIITPRSAARIAGMERIAPADDLTDIVEHHWIVTWDHRDRAPVAREVLPDPSVNLAVEPDGVLLYGVTSGRSTHVLAGAGTVVGTKFRAGGFSGFLPGPVRAITDRTITLYEAFGTDGNLLADVLKLASAPEKQIGVVAAFLRSHRPPADPQRELVAQIVEAMRSAPAGTTVAAIADRFAFTPRNLQRLFAMHVGATPKHVLQRFRHQRAHDLLTESPGAGRLARLAAELGYFDQAHFTQDFRTATARSPGKIKAIDPGRTAPNPAAMPEPAQERVGRASRH